MKVQFDREDVLQQLVEATIRKCGKAPEGMHYVASPDSYHIIPACVVECEPNAEPEQAAPAAPQDTKTPDTKEAF
jgi:hypothetical protein